MMNVSFVNFRIVLGEEYLNRLTHWYRAESPCVRDVIHCDGFIVRVDESVTSVDDVLGGFIFMMELTCSRRLHIISKFVKTCK